MRFTLLILFLGLSSVCFALDKSEAKSESIRIEVNIDKSTASANVDIGTPLMMASENSDEAYQIRYLGVVDGEHLLEVTQVGELEKMEFIGLTTDGFAVSQKMASLLNIRIVQENGSKQDSLKPETCCRTCNGWTTCGCKVESCLGCCCGACCDTCFR